MGRMQVFLDLVKRSRLLAPNLKELTLTCYTGMSHRGNHVAREVVRDHLAALRWMNPNAVIYLREMRGQGTPSISYSLCAWIFFSSRPRPSSLTLSPPPSLFAPAISGVPADGGAPKAMEITPSLTPDEVVAKVMMAARDPDLAASGGVAPSELAAAAKGGERGAAKAAPAAAASSAAAAAAAAAAQPQQPQKLA